MRVVAPAGGMPATERSGERTVSVRIVVAEDSYLIREALRSLLDAQDDLELVAIASNLPDLLAAVDTHTPDVVVTDIRMPPGGRDEGIQAAERLATSHPDVGVVVLSQYMEPEFALRLLDTGSRGRAYLLKERVGDLKEIRQAIATVLAGGSVLDPSVVDALVAARRHRDDPVRSRLTPRECEVLGLVARGLSNPAIADELTLTSRAVEKHVTAIFQKLDLHHDDTAVHRRVRAALVYLAASDT